MISQNNDNEIHIYHNHQFPKTHVVETWFQMIANWMRHVSMTEGYGTLLLPENNQFFPRIQYQKCILVFMVEIQIVTEQELKLVEADAIFNVSHMSRETLKSKNRFRFIGKLKVSKKEERKLEDE